MVNWRDVPSDAEIVFVSHEWLSWAHPDPEGEQLRVLCRVLERLKEGGLGTEMDPMHTILYKHKFMTNGKEWKTILKRTYLWVDWFSMPQPGAEKEDKIGKEAMATLRAEGSRAIRSIPAYVERSDFIMILVPGCHHSNRKVSTCYRTWRRRGWCLLELYATVMARDASNPPLLVRSEKGTPMWMSPMEILKLSIGMADFTCCQRNHIITTETQKVLGGGNTKKIHCDKPIVASILEQLIDAKIHNLFHAEGNLTQARLYSSFKHWWMHKLHKIENVVADKEESAVTKYKRKLEWREDEKWFDRSGVGLLMYAVSSDEVDVVRELLHSLKQNFKGNEYTLRLESRIRKKGYPTLGIPGGVTTLIAATAFGSPKVVSMLFEYGANVRNITVHGDDAFILGSTLGRTENLDILIKTHKNYDLEKQNRVLGSTALINAVYIGPCKLEVVRKLLHHGARIDARTHGGFSVLIAACANEDSDPEVVRTILRVLDRVENHGDAGDINYRMKSQTVKWKLIRGTAKLMVRTRLAKSYLVHRFAHGAGLTALHYAAKRGDTEIVKLLLEAGADPFIENEMGLDAFELCEKFGPFPRVHDAMYRYVSEKYLD